MTDTPQLKRTELSRVGTTAVLTLASDKVNALDREVLDEISTFVRFCEEDPGVGALVLTGAGNVFSAGLNVSQILANEKSYTDALLESLTSAFADLFRCPLPTVAAVNGAAIAGGCLLACACDKRLIADEARIGVTELKVGVAFPTVAIELLKHVAGPRAEQLILDAGLLDAEDACRYGLAHHHLPRAELQASAMAEAEKLATLDAGAYALAKASVRREALIAIDRPDPAFDRQVLEHWRADETRASLERLLAPKG